MIVGAWPLPERKETMCGVVGYVGRREAAPILRRARCAALILCLGSAAQAQQPERLEYFRPGDRVLVRVEGESVLSDTFTVTAGPALPLPGLGDISLDGVPRSRIEAHLS